MVMRILSFTFLAAFFILSAQASCSHGTTLLRREVNDGKVKTSAFGYDDETGPLVWAGMDPNNTACHAGHAQSPIVLNASTPSAPPVAVTFHSAHEVELENLGSTLEVVGANGTTNFRGRDYHLKQFHFHTPSEHRLNGEYYPLEMHMVHESTTTSATATSATSSSHRGLKALHARDAHTESSFLVLAVLFELSENNTTSGFLSGITESLHRVKEPGSITQIEHLDLSDLATAIQTKPKYHYVGSLTTPPCSEGINFVVLKEPLELDVKTYNAMKKIMKFNARYTQNALGRDNLLEMAAAQFAG
ncbi:hypothetical protein AAF712_013199 [Marasmius tenuissimus]|uniref:Carbonic anhydrase n=1 Tax=Marasmius tenuissimus TaxID=585030 RepID=A0ABR2ZFI5_9AGAR